MPVDHAAAAGNSKIPDRVKLTDTPQNPGLDNLLALVGRILYDRRGQTREHHLYELLTFFIRRPTTLTTLRHHRTRPSQRLLAGGCPVGAGAYLWERCPGSGVPG